MGNILKLVRRAVERCGGWDMECKKIYCLYWSVWRYFDYPEATEARRERADIDPERRFNQLIWETIVRDLGKHKGILVMEYFNFNIII